MQSKLVYPISLTFINNVWKEIISKSINGYYHSAGYMGLIVGIRNELFELKILKTRRFNIPVISIGNITVGGSGKTPHV